MAAASPVPPGASAGLRLVSTAPIHWTGGYDHLLVALRRVRDGGVDARLTIAPPGPSDEDTAQQVRFDVDDLGLSDAVTWVPPRRRWRWWRRVPRARVGAGRHGPARLADVADLAVVAAVRGDRVGQVRWALDVGLPVVAVDGPDLADLGVRTGGRVVLVPRRAPDALAAALSGAAGAGPQRA